nr:heme lyase NrfEFG subunit NrfF [Mannheimia massilioguelmaensis]
MKKLLLLGLVLFAFCVRAEMVDTYEFKNVEDRTRAVTLAKSLRCPQCQNQNLVESNSPIAYDLRIEVYKMVDEGKSNQQIIDVMTSRFGNFVLYQPPFELNTALLWLIPVGLILLALLLGWRYVVRRAKIREIPTALNAEQQQALNDLLAKGKERE